MLERFPGKVKIVNKNYPLSKHKFAKRAALAALAADRQGKFWELHAKLFEKMKELSNEKIDELAQEVGLDMAKLKQDMNDQAIVNIIQRDLSDGKKAGVRGTPTIFVNGKKLKRRSFEGFQSMIREELEKSR